jgi:predicted nucleotidyltransferase
MAATSTLVLAGRPVDLVRLAEVCQRFGVSELAVFGSVARGDARPDSDVDLLFTLAPGARLGFALFDLERELTELFGRDVDLLSKGSIHRLLRDAVLAEARVLYAA